MTSWLQQMTEIGLLPPAVDLTPIMDEAEFEPPDPTCGDVSRPLANDPSFVEGGPQLTTTPFISTSVLDSTLRHFFLDDGGASESDGDLPNRASDSDEDENTAATSEAATRTSATGSSVQSESMPSAQRKRKRKRTIDAKLHFQSPARDVAAPLFAPSKSRRSRSDGTLVPAYPCARCIEKDIQVECRICYVGGACNACRARGRKCDLVDPETKHTHTGSIAKNLLKRLGGKNSKGSRMGKLKL